MTEPRILLEELEPRILLTSYLVDSLADVVASDGFITLREALQAANTNTAINEAPAGSATETDDIDFDGDLFSSGQRTITLGGTQLEITDDLALTGPGADLLTIDANDTSRVLYVGSGVTASAESAIS